MNKWRQSQPKDKFLLIKMESCPLSATLTFKGQPCSSWLMSRTLPVLNNAMSVLCYFKRKETQTPIKSLSRSICKLTRSNKVELSLRFLRKWACLPRFGKSQLKCTSNSLRDKWSWRCSHKRPMRKSFRQTKKLNPFLSKRPLTVSKCSRDRKLNNLLSFTRQLSQGK